MCRNTMKKMVHAKSPPKDFFFQKHFFYDYYNIITVGFYEFRYLCHGCMNKLEGPCRAGPKW